MIGAFTKYFRPQNGTIISKRIPAYNTTYRIHDSKKIDVNEMVIPIQKCVPKNQATFFHTLFLTSQQQDIGLQLVPLVQYSQLEKSDSIDQN